jgi:peptide methionine sulfoxide reductase msrA/msrB
MNKMFLVWWVVLIAWLLVLWRLFTKNSTEPSDASMDRYTGWIYTDYDQTTLSSLSWDIVLFFHADRCPACIAAEKSFLASGIPDGLTILKVDFDTATELRKKYTVLSQTSFVLIQPDGTMIKRWVWGRTIQDIIEKIDEAKKVESSDISVKQSSWKSSTAYFAGGCFRCMEWPFESLDGVTEVINGYIWGDERNANYNKVSLGVTKHREAVKVVYDPDVISYAELLATYRRQIDPTDAWGQFADRGSQYRTAIYYATDEEKKEAIASKNKLAQSGKFSKPIVVEILPATPFYPAEEYHQDYYKKNSADYKSYKKWSGREDFIHSTWKDQIPSSAGMTTREIISRKDKKPKKAEDLTAEQRRILFEWWTEPPFNNAYRDNHEAGIYVDVIDGTPLFSSNDKFDSGTGWPSFSKPIDESMVNDKKDTSAGMIRTEIKSSSSNGHLWHIFDDGPADKWWQRYCINSAALEFIPLADLDAKWYSEYKKLFTK